MDQTGLITVVSAFSFQETLQRLVAAIGSRGLHVFTRVDHAKGARDVGMQLRPTEVVIFGNPNGGTPLMMENQMSGIDLPVKALVWENESGQVLLTYNDPRWIAQRHGLGALSSNAITMLAGGVAAIVHEATSAS